MSFGFPELQREALEETAQEASTTGEIPVQPGFRRDPQPGHGDSAGPALTYLVAETRRAAAAMELLARQAAVTARERLQIARAQVQLDSNGDGAIKLYDVPQGATGYLMMLALEIEGATPAAPVTSANLWHGIFEGPGGNPSQAQVFQRGGLLDCSPLSPAADAQLPFVYSYGDRNGAPTIYGPGAFYALVDAGTASVRVTARAEVLVVQPEP